jgi:hypothetical protein
MRLRQQTYPIRRVLIHGVHWRIDGRRGRLAELEAPVSGDRARSGTRLAHPPGRRQAGKHPQSDEKCLEERSAPTGPCHLLPAFRNCDHSGCKQGCTSLPFLPRAPDTIRIRQRPRRSPLCTMFYPTRTEAHIRSGTCFTWLSWPGHPQSSVAFSFQLSTSDTTATTAFRGDDVGD